MSDAEAEVEEAIQKLMALGLVDRWRCEVCDDWIPYQTPEMTEAESRRVHERRHQ
jgi:hypothetical protein